jgi:hypothetical protein
MKLTTKKLRQIIKETINEMQSEPPKRDELHVRSTPDGWVVTGTYKGRKVEFDSSNKKYKPSIRDWDNSPRFMMARELLGHFGGPESEEGMRFNIRKQDLDGVNITVDGRSV